jgi:broad specificity phosphatase PhoE
MESLILARHGESIFSERGLVNGEVTIPGPLTSNGEEEARALGGEIADDPIGLCVTTEFERTRQTAELALAGRDVPRLVVRELNDPLYGRYEGGVLETYRSWAGAAASADPVPGGGESRRHIIERYTRGFRIVLARVEQCALLVAHSLPIAYALAARDEILPGRRVPLVEHARPYRFAADELDRAVTLLEGWCAAPTW